LPSGGGYFLSSRNTVNWRTSKSRRPTTPSRFHLRQGYGGQVASHPSLTKEGNLNNGSPQNSPPDSGGVTCLPSGGGYFLSSRNTVNWRTSKSRRPTTPSRFHLRQGYGGQVASHPSLAKEGNLNNGSPQNSPPDSGGVTCLPSGGGYFLSSLSGRGGYFLSSRNSVKISKPIYTSCNCAASSHFSTLRCMA
jgi:hypothetical protein